MTTTRKIRIHKQRIEAMTLAVMFDNLSDKDYDHMLRIIADHTTALRQLERIAA